MVDFRAEAIQDFKKKSHFSGLFAVLMDWLIILFVWMAYARFPSVVTWFVALLITGRQQHALAVMGHEAVHGNLHPKRAVNDFVGQWLCFSGMFFSFHSYRYVHLQHHRAPLSAQDPDIRLTGGYPVSARTLARRLLRDATGRTTIKFIRSFNALVPESIRASSSPTLSYWVVNALLFGAFFACGRPLDFFLLWIVPQLFVLPVLLRLRGIAEHAGLEQDEDQSRSTRTVTAFWYRVVFAPHNVSYHVEHHLHPHVGFKQLPALHLSRLRTNPGAPRAMTPSEVLAQVVRR